jgi:hypothetical protein
MVSRMGRLMDVGSVLGAFVVGSSRCSTGGRKFPIVYGGRGLKVL